jgi:predicted amidophosphoribosyltransferase
MVTSYRVFDRPQETAGWTKIEWTKWIMEQGVTPSVIADEKGVCYRCFGPLARPPGGDPWPTCFGCDYVYDGYLCATVPICYSTPAGLESVLWRAKNDPGHAWLAAPLACLLDTFLDAHGGCLEVAYGRFDVLTVVPSHASTRGGMDHMKYLHGSLTPWSGSWDLDLLVKTRPDRVPRRSVEPDLFAARRDLTGRRVLLVDDTYTSGGTVASAAGALRRAGAERVVALTIGRQLSPESAGGPELIARTAARPFLSDTCAVHVTW